MNNSIFEKAYIKSMQYEGEYVYDKDDKGGETYKGISRVYNPEWEGWVIIDNYKKNNSLKELKNNEKLNNLVKKFYFANYWLKLKLDKINSSLIAETIFDAAINCGKVNAIKFLQKTLNLLNRNLKLYQDLIVDGIIGIKTIDSLHKSINLNGENLIYNCYNVYRFFYYIKLMEKNATYEKYIGWLKRIKFINYN